MLNGATAPPVADDEVFVATGTLESVNTMLINMDLVDKVHNTVAHRGGVLVKFTSEIHRDQFLRNCCSGGGFAP